MDTDGVGRRVVPWLVALGIVGPFAFAKVSETDLGWHLAVGRWMAERGPLTQNALSWTYPTYPIHSTSSLFDRLAYATFQAGGLLGIQALTFVLVAATLGAVALTCHQVNPKGGAWATPLIAALLLPRITPRAFLISWLCLALCGLLCRLPLRGWGAWQVPAWTGRLLCVPVIALAANFHSGAILSLALLGLFCLEAAARDKKWGRELLIAGAGGTALLMNPSGPQNVLYAAHHLWLYEAMKISELQHTRFLDLPAFYILAAVALGLAWMGRRQSLANLLSVGAFALCGAWVARVAFDFYLVAAPVLAVGIDALKKKEGRRAQLLLISALALCGVVPNLHRAASLRMAPQWDRTALPVRAADFIAAHDLKGRFFNSFGEGGYLEFKLPGVPVFQDGRTQAYPAEFFAEQVRAHQSASTLDTYLRGLGVTWALTQTTDVPLAGTDLIEAPGWALVYWDEHDELLVRRDVPELAPLIASSEYRYFHPLLTRPAEIPAQVARLTRPDSLAYLEEIQRFEAATPDNAFAELAHCALSTHLGRPDAGLACARAQQLAGDEATRKLVAQAQRMN